MLCCAMLHDTTLLVWHVLLCCAMLITYIHGGHWISSCGRWFNDIAYQWITVVYQHDTMQGCSSPLYEMRWTMGSFEGYFHHLAGGSEFQSRWQMRVGHPEPRTERSNEIDPSCNQHLPVFGNHWNLMVFYPSGTSLPLLLSFETE